MIIILVIVLVAILYFVGIYNALVRMRNQIKNAWSQIDVQLKRRHDLIPNLIETVKGYMQHERETLENVIAARAKAVNASGVAGKAEAEGYLNTALDKLLAVVENYPNLKADQSFATLQEELSSTENRIAFARQYFNDSVLNFNNRVEIFPSNLIASSMNFQKEVYFEIKDAAEKEAPQVKF
ncbi:MAG: LemA family protein [Candidatus Cloacimonetes bacterium]|nr:LemA family protein [Candidatus Cloacimonadota bacterium]